MEILSALIVAGVPRLLAHRAGFSWDFVVSGTAPVWWYALTLWWIVSLLLLLALAVVDGRHFILPNGANLSLGVFGFLVGLALLAAGDAMPIFRASALGSFALMIWAPPHPILNHLWGAVIGGALFAALWGVSRGRAMGFGDVKLALATGMLVGFPDIILATLLSFMLGGVWGGALLVLRHHKPKDHIPFGPFFVAGTILTFAYGEALLRWYFGAFPG
jgi:prepilin signal peptidase PulO-like enzyme (type II secretory pathway)